MNMTNIHEANDVQVAWTKFQDAFLEAIEKYIPKGKIPKRKSLHWLTKDLAKMMKKQNRYLKHVKSSTTDTVKYRKLRNKVVTKFREAKNAFFRKLT